MLFQYQLVVFQYQLVLLSVISGYLQVIITLTALPFVLICSLLWLFQGVAKSILRTALTVDGLELMKPGATQKVVAGTAVLKENHIATFQLMA